MNDVISQWNNSAQKYKEEQTTSLYAEKNMRIVMERFPHLNGEKVLDLGCGYGLYTNYFKNIGGKATGIDGSEVMINEAHQLYPDCNFFISDITKPLDFDDGTFDIIFSNQVLMDIENIETVFSECHRILKTGGIFYYSIVHPAFYDGNWLENENIDL